MNLSKALPKIMSVLTVPPFAFISYSYIGPLVKETQTSFRDKSAMYGKDLQEGQPPSW